MEFSIAERTFAVEGGGRLAGPELEWRRMIGVTSEGQWPQGMAPSEGQWPRTWGVAMAEQHGYHFTRDHFPEFNLRSRVGPHPLRELQLSREPLERAMLG